MSLLIYAVCSVQPAGDWSFWQYLWFDMATFGKLTFLIVAANLLPDVIEYLRNWWSPPQSTEI